MKRTYLYYLPRKWKPVLKQLDYSTRNELLEDNSMWYNGWDNYFQFSPAVLAFGLKWGGMESKHKLSEM